MNIELLKKLVKLATNNPNENEANLAAIKVCRMLLEDDFKCITIPINPQNQFQDLFSGLGNMGKWNQPVTNNENQRDIYNELINMINKTRFTKP